VRIWQPAKATTTSRASSARRRLTWS
jgi:hypothetical protein